METMALDKKPVKELKLKLELRQENITSRPPPQRSRNLDRRVANNARLKIST